MLHDRYKTDSFHPGIQVHFGDRYPGSVLVVDPHPSQGEKLTFIFRPWHDSQQLTIRVSSSFNILEICKNNVWFQSWCRVHESQSISRWEESSDSNLPPIPCLLTTKCGNCKWNRWAVTQDLQPLRFVRFRYATPESPKLRPITSGHPDTEKHVGRILNFRTSPLYQGWMWKRVEKMKMVSATMETIKCIGV